MAARKKASKKSSRTVSKKTKASSGPAAPRKRKAVAASAVSRPSRPAAKSKAARSAKAKSGENESVPARRRVDQSGETREREVETRTAQAPARAQPATAAKPGKPMDAKLQVSENQAKECRRRWAKCAPGASEAKAAREAPSAPLPNAKASAGPLAKRAPAASKAAKPGVSDNVERDEDGAAPKSAKASASAPGLQAE